MKRTAATVLTVLVLLTAVTGVSDRAWAKPYDAPPSWATISWDGLGRDIYILTNDLNKLGRWCQLPGTPFLAGGRSSSAEPAIYGQGWRTFRVARAFRLGEAGKPDSQTWVEKVTIFARGSEALAHARMDGTSVLDRDGRNMGGADCGPRWATTNGPWLDLLDKYQQMESGSARSLALSCRWLDEGEMPSFTSRRLTSCQ
jgi:hypothetical protein